MKLTRQQRIRLGVLGALVVLFFLTLSARLVQLQVLNHSQYSGIVERQSRGQIEIPAARGLIYDRHGQVVADNIVLSSLYAYPANDREVTSAGRYVERLLNIEPGRASKKYGLSKRRFRWIRRCLDDKLADQVEADAPPGLHLRKERRRSYPFGRVGKQILGFTDIDNRGQSGLEFTLDTMLAGRTGLADVCRDGLRNTFRVKERALVQPEPGRSMVLTADWRLQEIVEEELRAAVEEHSAKRGMALFVDCRNGDILAMAHHDPLEPDPDKPTKLRAISDQFEPGSVFKVVTAAGLLDAGLIDFGDSIYCEDGQWRVGRRTLHDDKELEWLSFRQVMELSSNIGIAKHSLKLGGEELYETARRFCLGQKLRVGLPGETRGRLVAPDRWSDYTVSALAMGHSVAVNCLQMAMVMAAVANGGELLRPHLIRGEVNNDGAVVNCADREVMARAMKKSTADTLRSILRGVVENGTATAVNSEVVTIAGKTGTAEIPDLENRRYFKNRFMASFAGFFPAERPLVAGIVVLQEPHPIHYGGWTAGPAFRRMAERYTVQNPDVIAVPERTLAQGEARSNNTVEAPDLMGYGVDMALGKAADHGVEVRAGADTGCIVWQFPSADRLMFTGGEILTAVIKPDETSPRMIDLTGLSIRQAAAFLNEVGVEFVVSGHGTVRRQSLRPGSLIKPDDICRLQCRAT